MKSARAVTLLLAAMLVLVACDGAPGPGGEGDFPVRSPVTSPSAHPGPVIALVGTMSGPNAWRGEDAFEGADLAVNVINQEADAGRLPVQLVTLDDGGDPLEAARLVEEIAEDPRTVGVVYAGPTGGLPRAVAALSNSGIPAISCYGDLYSARLLRTHLFQVAPPLLWQARRQVAYIARDRRYRRAGLLAARGLDGDTAVQVVRDAIGSEGLPRPRSLRFGPDDDLEEQLDTLERRRVEALIVHGRPQDLPRVVEALAARGSRYRDTAGARTVSAPARVRRAERHSGRLRPWRPQVLGFDLAIAPQRRVRLPAGTVASDTYARGVAYLPIPSFVRFRELFTDWWGSEPLRWQQRAYDAVAMIGWAAERTEPGDDVAATLERLEEKRFGGLDVTFGPDDHTAVDQQTVGLWVVPRDGAEARDAGSMGPGLPWVPLGRGFSTNGRRTDIPPRDWRHLFRDPPPRQGPGPRIRTGRFGVVTRRTDPVH